MLALVALPVDLAAPRVQRRPSLTRRQLCLVFAAALTVRVVYVLLALRSYSFHADDGHYSEIASNVAAGRGVSSAFPYLWVHHTAFRPPLYPLLLGAAYAVFGVHIGVAQGLNILLGSLVVVLAALVAGRLAGRRAALVAALVAALHPALLANDGVVLTEPLALLLMLLAVWLLLTHRALLAGLALGLLVLTRPSAQLLVPTLAVLLVLQARWRQALAVVAMAGLVVAPWVARNVVYFGKPVIVTSNGFNLAAIWSDQSIAAGHFLDPVRDPSFTELRGYQHSNANLNEATLDATFRQAGIDGLRTHLGRVPSQVKENLLFLSDVSWGRNDNAEQLDGRNLAVRHAALPLIWLLELAGVAGLAVLVRRSDGVLLVVTAGYFVAVSLVTVAPPRLRAPFDVLACIAIGVLVSRLSSRRRHERHAEPDARPRRATASVAAGAA